MQCDQASGGSCGRSGRSDGWNYDLVTVAKRPIAVIRV
jgi:hypothetical protein